MVDDLLALSGRLAKASPHKSRQADLRRAISTAYYALFHAVCKNCADCLVGTVKANRPDHAWRQVYRGIEHGNAKSACIAARNIGFPAPTRDCINAFVDLQEARHDADYDPHHRITRAAALTAVQMAKDAIKDLKTANLIDRRAFAVQVPVKKR